MIEKLSFINILKYLSIVLFTTGALLNCASQGASEKQSLVWPDNELYPPRIELVEILKPQTFKETSLKQNLMDFVFGASVSSRMSQPFGVAVDSSGSVYVVEGGAGQITVFDRRTNNTRSFGERTGLIFPTDILIIDSLVYVSDGRAQRIFCYNMDGELITKLGKRGELLNPGGMAYHEDTHKIYITDSQSHQLAVFDVETGLLDTTFGTRGTGEGEFNFPSNIAIYEDKVFVLDAMNFRVQILTLDGQYIHAFGQAGDSAGDLYRPRGIAISSDGFVFVSDSHYSNFQIFDEDGEIYLFVGILGTNPGEFKMPADMTFDQDDKLYVTDAQNGRIQVFQYIKYE